MGHTQLIKKTVLNHFAFTLAEVLITLGIIGIVAAMTIPSLIKRTNEAELTTAFKKSYSIANQAYKMAVQENGSGFGPSLSGTTGSYTKFNALKSQLKVVKTCTFGTSIKGECWASAGVGYPAGIPSCSKFGNITGGQESNEAFVTADGMFWVLYTYTATTGADYLMIDVNGFKGPNDWAKDVYIFDMLDTTITTPTGNGACYGNAKHNDGSTVLSSETLNRLMN